MFGGECYLDAWHMLSSDRPIGMAMGMIPFTAIDRYAARFWFNDPDDFARLVRIIHALDGAYLEHINKKPEEAS